MKKNIKIIIISLITIAIISIFILIMTFNKKEKEIIEVEVYSEIKLSELIKNNEKILTENFYIDTTSLGEKEITYSYYDNNKKKNDSLFIKVVDKEKPYVMLGNTYTYVIGTKFNMENTVFCGDNVTKNPKKTIVGKYDLNKVGEYPLIFKVEDEFGNVNEKKFTLKVIEEKIPSKSSYITFEELKNRLPNDASLMIDVSKWQADIDWKKVFESGIKYAMLRLGTQKGVDLDSRIDEYFDKNIKEARANGIQVGVYYFTYANDIHDAKEQAKWVVDVLKDYTLDLPVAFDWECWDLFDEFNLNFYELNMIADTFLKELEKEGYDTLLYGSKNYIENVWKYFSYDIWLAHYTKETSYQGEKMMWQFTSSGRIPGIKGNVDVNFYYNK
ncbi:MAG: glycoside hydrolase family 25 protein [Bacilli bacterium]|nr:glycoside hydrolase family 25 protein [Bacilli bacterium]